MPIPVSAAICAVIGFLVSAVAGPILIPLLRKLKFGQQIGRLLCFLYAEIRSEIPYVYEKRLEYLTICNELFIEVYNCFEGVEVPDYEELRSIVYWYASDYCDVFVADRVEEQERNDEIRSPILRW